MSDKDLVVLNKRGMTVSGQGLEIQGHIAKDQWAEYGVMLGALETALPWVVGDWLVYGEKEYGKEEAYKIAGEIFPRYGQGTLKEYERTALITEISVRDPELSYSHYKVTQFLPPKERKTWLAKAKAGEWNSTVLRKAIRKTEALLAPPKEQTWERTPEVSRLLGFLKAWNKAIDDDIMPALGLGKFSPEAAKFYGRQLRELADRMIATAKEMEKWAGTQSTRNTN